MFWLKRRHLTGKSNKHLGYNSWNNKEPLVIQNVTFYKPGVLIIYIYIYNCNAQKNRLQCPLSKMNIIIVVIVK